MKQRAASRPRPVLRAVQSTRYIPVPGTWGWNDAWYSDPASDFIVTLALQGFAPIRAADGRPFRWSTELDGVMFWRRHAQWQAGADALVYFCEHLPYEDRNLIAYSHGGAVALMAAASGFKIRSLTTISTPCRNDIGAREALAHLGFWQHIYDADWDPSATWGGLFDFDWSLDRTFKHLGANLRRYPMKGIGHGKILTDARYLQLWDSEPWLENIRAVGRQEAA